MLELFLVRRKYISRG